MAALFLFLMVVYLAGIGFFVSSGGVYSGVDGGVNKDLSFEDGFLPAIFAA